MSRRTLKWLTIFTVLLTACALLTLALGVDLHGNSHTDTDNLDSIH